MSDPVLFYTPAACSLACMVALEWAGAPYRVCRVEKQDLGGAAFRRINPRGQVPALLEDGRVLLETNAILTHVADLRPEANLLPANGSWGRDVANQWLAYLGSGFHSAFWPYFYPGRYSQDQSLHEPLRLAAVEGIRRELATVDAHLAGREFIQGDRPSVLDAYLHSMDRWASRIVDTPADYPQVWRHQKMMARDPAVRLATAVERGDGKMPTTSKAFGGHVLLSDL